MNVIAPAIISSANMQWLVNICDKVHKEAQCFKLLSVTELRVL